MASVWAIMPPIDVPTTWASVDAAVRRGGRRCHRPCPRACRPQRHAHLLGAAARSKGGPPSRCVGQAGVAIVEAQHPEACLDEELIAEASSHPMSWRPEAGDEDHHGILGCPEQLVAQLDAGPDVDALHARMLAAAGHGGQTRRVMLSPRWPIPPVPRAASPVRAHSPGRVNLIGDHTDYNEGVALPMAVDLGHHGHVRPRRGHASRAAVVARSRARRRRHPHAPRPRRPREASNRAGPATSPPSRRPFVLLGGGSGTVTTTLPVGAGLSSSAALEVALALVLGYDAEPTDHGAHLPARRAGRHGGPDRDHGPTGRERGPGGLRAPDRLRRPVAASPSRCPPGPRSWWSTRARLASLDRSAYAQRRAECEAAAHRLGPLGHVDPHVAGAIPDPLLRRRARHVVDRVRAGALVRRRARTRATWPRRAGSCRRATRSLAQDFEVSTPGLDSLVDSAVATPRRLRGPADRSRIRRLCGRAHRARCPRPRRPRYPGVAGAARTGRAPRRRARVPPSHSSH